MTAVGIYLHKVQKRPYKAVMGLSSMVRY